MCGCADEEYASEEFVHQKKLNWGFARYYKIDRGLTGVYP
jgi:hypothetical protein